MNQRCLLKVRFYDYHTFIHTSIYTSIYTCHLHMFSDLDGLGRTGPAEHRKIPGGLATIKKYCINKLMFVAKTLDNVGRSK